MTGLREGWTPGGSTVGTVAELAGLAYFEVDADHNVVAMSPAMERLTGFRSEEVIGRSCLNLNRCQDCLRECGVFQHGTVRDAPLKLYRADGSEVMVLKSGQVYRNDAGEIVGAIEFVRTPGTVEPQLGRGAPPREVDAMLKGLGRLLLVLDGTFRVVAHVSSLPELTGIPPERLLGMPVEELLGSDLFGSASSFRAAIANGERREGWAARLLHADGSDMPVSITVGTLDPPDVCGASGGRFVVMLRPDELPASAPAFQGIVSRSPQMQRIFRLVELLRDNDSTVLITGESGTGKELVARALHTTSHRREGPFVAVNCAAIPPELLESELFGHVRGAFTGAVKDRPGRFELAEGGTLFLDEIGDLALSLQAKILRFLQERTFERVGDARTRSVDVRVIAATHVDLAHAVSERRFRDDLYYRLRVVPIHIPALRERLDDLELLVRYFLDRIGKERGRSLRLAPPASRALLSYAWPGNVRELQNALEYATTVCEGQTIHLEDLPREISASGAPVGSLRPAERPEDGRGMDLASAAEVERIRNALERARYRRAEAAALLGVSRTTLWRKMREYGL